MIKTHTKSYRAQSSSAHTTCNLSSAVSIQALEKRLLSHDSRCRFKFAIFLIRP